jgi:hypothetical protein
VGAGKLTSDQRGGRGEGRGTPIRSRSAQRRGPKSTHAAASAITAASAPAGSAGSGRKLSRRPRSISNDRRIRSTPAAASQRCPRLSIFQAPIASRTRESSSRWAGADRAEHRDRPHAPVLPVLRDDLLDEGMVRIAAKGHHAWQRNSAPPADDLPGSTVDSNHSVAIK